MSNYRQHGKKDWALTIANNRRLYPEAYKHIDDCTKAHFVNTGQGFKTKPNKFVPKEHKTTNAELAKELGITPRQVSKCRNNKRPWPKKEN